MNVDERIRTTLTLEAGSVTPPGLDLTALRTRAGQVRRRQRTLGVTLAAAAVAAAVGIGVLLVPHPSSEPTPAPRPPKAVATGTPPSTAVWYDADGLHRGTRVYAVPGTAAPISIALVRGGAVYLVPSTLHIRYQPWHGVARDLGHGSREAGWLLGPGSDPEGSTAAWFDGPDLVMYDTARHTEIARVPEPGRRVMPYYENEFGTRFHYVDGRRVVWDAQDGRTLGYDRVTGRTTTVTPRSSDGQSPDVTRAGGTLRVSGASGNGPVRFSPDGRYLVSLDDTGAAVTPVVEAADGTSWRAVASTTDASVGWGYGHTLMYLQSGGTGQFDDPAPLLVYDARTRQVVAVEHRGEVILPAG
jgi:hypothetical protein